MFKSFIAVAGLLFSFAALAAPVVSLTSPANGTRYLPPAAITLTANASDPTDTIARVDFYSGTTLIGTATSVPYTVRWTEVPTGAYSVTATAVNSRNDSATATPVNLIVNTPPTATLTADVTAQQDWQGASIRLAANAADADGSIALVEFYDNGILFAATATAPYVLVPRFRPPGIYHFTARAIDNLGGVASSNVMTVTVAPSPVPPMPSGPGEVVMTAPLDSAVHFTPADIELEAAASAAGNPIARVDFYNEATLIGTATATPYRFTWRNVPSGKYFMVAKATDSQGIVRTSDGIVFHVNDTRPVALTSPLSNATSPTAPASIALEAMVADNDGRMGTVEFLSGETVLATVTAPPYAARWKGVAKGSYTIRARATDRRGVVTLSAPVTVIVTEAANIPPTVSMLATPTNATAPATILLNAAANDADGRVAKVEFFNGSTLLASVTAAPYAFNWMNVAAGSYTITARATDDRGAVTGSEPMAVSVSALPVAAQVYYIDSDHLNTPRVITDASNRIVWQLENSDPFGDNLPQEDPGNTGNRLEFNLRFPGQYFDRETRLHYNYFRTYDPDTGRYVESDPIGLDGGINTYAYAANNPIIFFDPDGRLCIYHQSTGSLTCTNDTTGATYLSCNGYAGTGNGRNNPAAQNQSSVGPLPQGDYTVGDSFRHPHAGPGTRRLTPASTNQMYGRSGMMIHGDNASHDASEGCIVAPRGCRGSIPTGETLRVVP
jgi:RHS repeat-associated protein